MAIPPTPHRSLQPLREPGGLVVELLQYTRAAIGQFFDSFDKRAGAGGLKRPPYQEQVRDLPFITRGSKLSSRRDPSSTEEAALQALKDQGFKAIIGLTDEWDYDTKAAAKIGLNNLYLRVEDMSTPSRDQIGRFLMFISKAENQPFYLHCDAGVARTDLFVGIAKIVFGGMTADQVLSDFDRDDGAGGTRVKFKLKLRNQRDFLRIFEALYRSPNRELNFTAYGFPPPVDGATP